MITIKLKQVMSEYGITITDLSDSTGIARSTLTPLVNKPDQVKGIKIDTLDTLCDFFGVSVGDIIQFSTSSHKYKIIASWLINNREEGFLDLVKRIGARERHTLLHVVWTAIMDQDFYAYRVEVSPFPKKDISTLNLRNIPGINEFVDGKLFIRDFIRQNVSARVETTQAIVKILLANDFFKAHIKTLEYITVSWNIGNMLENNTKYTYEFDVKNGIATVKQLF